MVASSWWELRCCCFGAADGVSRCGLLVSGRGGAVANVPSVSFFGGPLLTSGVLWVALRFRVLCLLLEACRAEGEGGVPVLLGSMVGWPEVAAGL